MRVVVLHIVVFYQSFYYYYYPSLGIPNSVKEVAGLVLTTKRYHGSLTNGGVSNN